MSSEHQHRTTKKKSSLQTANFSLGPTKKNLPAPEQRNSRRRTHCMQNSEQSVAGLCRCAHCTPLHRELSCERTKALQRLVTGCRGWEIHFASTRRVAFSMYRGCAVRAWRYIAAAPYIGRTRYYQCHARPHARFTLQICS